MRASHAKLSQDSHKAVLPQAFWRYAALVASARVCDELQADTAKTHVFLCDFYIADKGYSQAHGIGRG
jgi:hypothetical protein